MAHRESTPHRSSTQRLIDNSQWSGNLTVEGYAAEGDDSPYALNNAVSPGYFAAMGIPVLRGREFNDRDFRSAPPAEGATDFRVVVVNETFARRYFKDREALGRHIGFGSDPGSPTPMEVVGVVRDAKYREVRAETPAQVFVPYFESARPGSFTAYVRTTQPPEQMFGTIRTTVQSLDPGLPVHTDPYARNAGAPVAA